MAITLSESTHVLAVDFLLLVLFISFVLECVKPDVAVLTAVALLQLTGLLSPAKVLGVFSNSAPFTIAGLFIISGALSRTGCADWLGEGMAQAAKGSESRLLVGLLVSPFINNTPLVMVPVVISQVARVSPSPLRLLIPLSYATLR